MSTILQPRTIRCKATFGGKIPGQTLADTATGQIIATYRGNATTFQFGFFGNSDGLPLVLDDVQSLNLKIQPTQIPGGAVLADQTLAAEDLDLTLTAGTWADGSKQHAAFAFTNAEMNLDPQGARRTLWLVITALMTAGEEVTLAAGTMNLHEDNSAAAAPPPENPGTALTLEQGDARWAATTASAPARAVVINQISFIAVAGARYALSNPGLCTISDPATGSIGQSYSVIVVTGTAKWATGSTYSASRFQIIRACTATNTWETLPPTVSDTLAVGGGTWSGNTFTGPQSFSSTTRPTSSGTGTPAATSLMTRSDLETQLMGDDFVFVSDDFFGGGSIGNGLTSPGPLPWLVTTLVGTTTLRYGANSALTLPCPGGAAIQTGANNRDGGAISFAVSYLGGGPITLSDFNSTTIFKWRFYVQSDMGIRIGISGSASAPTFQATRFIGLAAHPAAAAWTSLTAIAAGDYRRPTTPNGRRYYAVTSGTTGAAEPTWPTGAAATVIDGGVTWTEDGRDGNANFQYIIRDGTALTGVITDSGVNYAPGWHTFALRYLGGINWAMSVDGVAEVPLFFSVAGTVTILMHAQALTTGQKHLLFDYFKFFQRGR